MTFRIGIDPGHGGDNTGIVVGDLVEKDWVFLAAQKLAIAMSGLPVIYELSRLEDTDISLAERGRLLAKCDLVLSLHVNAHPKESIHGMDVFYAADEYSTPRSTLQSKLVATAIAHACPLQLRTDRTWPANNAPGDPSDNWLQRPENVMRPHAPRPGVLIEFGYATNRRDREYLTSPGALDTLVTAARAGVCRWLELASARVSS